VSNLLDGMSNQLRHYHKDKFPEQMNKYVVAASAACQTPEGREFLEMLIPPLTYYKGLSARPELTAQQQAMVEQQNLMRQLQSLNSVRDVSTTSKNINSDATNFHPLPSSSQQQPLTTLHHLPPPLPQQTPELHVQASAGLNNNNNNNTPTNTEPLIFGKPNTYGWRPTLSVEHVPEGGKVKFYNEDLPLGPIAVCKNPDYLRSSVWSGLQKGVEEYNNGNLTKKQKLIQ